MKRLLTVALLLALTTGVYAGELFTLKFEVKSLESSRLDVTELTDDISDYDASRPAWVYIARCLKADVNLDRTISPGDALTLFNIVLGIEEANIFQLCAGDCNMDGNLTMSDVQDVFNQYYGYGTCEDDAKSAITKGLPNEVWLLSTTSYIGQTAEVTCIVRGVTDIKSWGMSITFPADKLEFIGWEPGDALPVDDNGNICNWDMFNVAVLSDGVIRAGAFTSSCHLPPQD